MLVTVTCRIPGPPATFTVTPPRFPRCCGAMMLTYFSAVVTPVTRTVCSTEPVRTFAVRTVTASCAFSSLPPAGAFSSAPAKTATPATHANAASGRSTIQTRRSPGALLF
ncbi:MAG TPA: hypothetical protein DEH78_00595 [Solibacterales bacterium]|nr:hypothetical protein [Bryobacterales bacterium]